jgi:sugar lactone lactonase YvrE
MHGRSLYRVRAADLLNAELPPALLSSRVERYSDKPISDGITIDVDNNIYLGDLAGDVIGIIGPDRRYRILAQSNDLSWVDSLCFGPEGKLYAVVNRLHQSAVLNGGVNLSRPPYFVLAVTALAPGLPGR